MFQHTHTHKHSFYLFIQFNRWITAKTNHISLFMKSMEGIKSYSLFSRSMRSSNIFGICAEIRQSTYKHNIASLWPRQQARTHTRERKTRKSTSRATIKWLWMLKMIECERERLSRVEEWERKTASPNNACNTKESHRLSIYARCVCV